MNSIDALLDKFAAPTRRDFLKTSGRLVVGFTAAANAGPLISLASAQAARGAGPYPDPDFRQLDSWIVIHQDNTATFYVGKTDLGQGTGTAFRQIMSDELDMASPHHLHHGQHRHHGGPGRIGRLDALQTDGYPMRRSQRKRGACCSTWRRGVSVTVDQLAVSDGVVTMKANPASASRMAN